MKPLQIITTPAALRRARTNLRARRAVAERTEVRGPEVAYLAALKRIVSSVSAEALELVRRLDDEVPTVVDDVRTDAANSGALVLEIDALRRRTRQRITTRSVGTELRETRTATARAVDRNLQRVLGIDITGIATSSGVDVSVFVERNVTLIQGMADDMLSSIATEVTRAGVSGLRHEALARIIQDRTGVSESRAALIARDQVLTLAADVNRQRQQQLGIERATWTTVGDEHVRDEHDELDGEVFAWSEGIATSDGRVIRPGEDVNCRCTGIPFLDDLLGGDDDD